MPIALVRKLETFAALSDSDRLIVRDLVSGQGRNIEARRDFAREGEMPSVMFLICEGWACRHKTLPDGRRQIVDLLVPGDLCDLNLQLLGERDHSLGAINAVRVLEIPFAAVDKAMSESATIARAMQRSELVVTATAREWTLNVGQRNAYERIAHFMLETFYRLQRVGKTRDNGIDWPLTQVDLAEVTGLTPVHVNRTLQQLRRDGLITLSARQLVIGDMQRMRQAAMFNPNYLHFEAAESMALAK